MKTKLTEMFGIEYPIVQSGMQWLAVPQLAAAVCNAGEPAVSAPSTSPAGRRSTSLPTRSTR